MFLRRQNCLIPGSIETGFSIFSSILRLIKKNNDHMSDAISIINDYGINKDNISLSNWICKDAYTGEFHQDNDSSYSLICVPFINRNKATSYLSKRGKYAFTFCWDINNKSEIKFNLDPGVSFYFLGSLYNHKQFVISEGEFWNLASYQNCRLYSALKCSISRLLYPTNHLN